MVNELIKEEIRTKILKYLKKQDLDKSVKDICRGVGYSYPTILKYLAVLLSEKVIERRVAGSSTLYRLRGGGYVKK